MRAGRRTGGRRAAATALSVRAEGGRLLVGERLSISFQRTLRIPDDGRTYPLPPGLGVFPLRPVAEFAERGPRAWLERGGFFLPMYQREALWIGFGGASWKPNAVKVGVGRVNAVSGAAWDETLRDDPQDYVVCPDQPWLDGINAGEGYVRQFVAMPLGGGYTVEAQVSGEERFGGIQLVAYEPKPGRFPDEPPPRDRAGPLSMMSPAPGGAMGLAAGGRMRQKIYPDPYGLDAWDADARGTVTVHLVNSEQYRAITGAPPPPTPIDARSYTELGLPWFDLYDEDAGDVEAPPSLTGTRSVAELDAERAAAPPDEPVDVTDEQVTRLRHDRGPRGSGGSH